MKLKILPNSENEWGAGEGRGVCPHRDRNAHTPTKKTHTASQLRVRLADALWAVTNGGKSVKGSQQLNINVREASSTGKFTDKVG